MRLAAGLTIAMLATAGPLWAQAVMPPPPPDARDRMAPKEMSFGGEIEPWWMALADCAAVFRAAPEDRAKAQAFATSAMAQVAKDRGITLREAGAVVMPYAMTGQGHERAGVLIATYGGATEVRSGCDGVMEKYKAL